MRQLIGILIVIATLGACSGMDAAECRTADWRAIGFEDGANGYTPQHFGVRRKACAGHGIAANFDAYMVGYNAGLERYCRPQNGYRLGARGRSYSGVCPAKLEGAFLASHADGYGLYTRGANLRKLRRHLAHSRKRAGEIEYQLAEDTARLVSPVTTTTVRAQIAVEMKQLVEEKVTLESEIPQLEQDCDAAEAEYRRYKDVVAARHGI